MDLYILNYNNYYNRIIKKENSLEDYLPYVTYGPLISANFNPKDGVNTDFTFGSNVLMYGGNGDYILAVENQEIISRWFIIDHDRMRNGQWDVQMRRDLLVDFLDDIMNADTFIEKANLNADDSLIFNNEDMIVNQIKTKETLLRDGSGVAWLVGYYGKDTPTERLTDIAVETNTLPDIPFIETGYDSIEAWPFYQYSNLATEQKKYSGNIIDANYYLKYALQAGTLSVGNRMRQRWFLDDYEATGFKNTSTLYKYTYDQADIVHLLHDSFASFGLEKLEELLPAYFTTNDEKELLKFKGQTIKAGARYFDVYVSNKDSKEQVKAITAGNLFNSLATIAAAVLDGTPNSDSFTVNCVTRQFTVYLDERFDLEATVNLSSAAKLKTEDAPYEMFAIPFGELDYDVYIGNGQFESFRSTKEVALATARAIQKSLQQGAFLYDLQLLPYCPVPEEILIPYYDPQVLGSGVCRMFCQESEFGKQYSPIKSANDKILGFVYYVPKSNFSVDLLDPEYAVAAGQSAAEIKLNNDCNKYRLCSPNYSNYFDFSVEKNKGIAYYSVDCSYKPYNPYIHINPNFGGLYGKDFNDPRGLVLGGDFSLSATTNAWEQYEIQNKNFQLSFDRQIQNMEFNNKMARKQDIASIIGGVAQGATSGALAGSMLGSGVAGAVIGGAFSLAGGIADITINEKLRNEALDYTKDMFGYQLGNIQALPNTLAKISSFNNNNKIFPVLEFYTCTDREKKAYLNKIAYNGMTVMAIGKIKDYMNNSWSYNDIESKGYIKGQLIRLDSIDDDFHIINSIAGELNKGAYFE